MTATNLKAADGMFQPVTPLQVFLALLTWLGIIFGVPLGCLLIYNCVSRGFFKRKNDEPESRGGEPEATLERRRRPMRWEAD